MKKLTSNQIREMWLSFFKSKKHYFLEPVSLVPVNDPSLLWINSGVATLKPYFDGRLTPPSKRLTNSQKSIRTNDIENVGITARHHTLFEMLGNFSIGDYFKKEAIILAWELLTSPKWFDIPKDKLYITVFNEDQEAYDIWISEIKIAKDHIFKMGRDTNFWDVGQGPCGPNTEIFFDRGEIWDKEKIGTKLLSEDIENDRYIEIWNIVFSQFNNDGNNNYQELPRKNIDTGAGLERFTSIFQNTPTNFETDIFWPIIEKIQTLVDKKYLIDNYFNENTEQTKINTAFKVIADHIRACVFAIADGINPSNKDRGYVIRRLIRRSSVYGKYLGINEPFLYLLVVQVINVMGDFYKNLISKKDYIIEIIKSEEIKFLKTLNKGQRFIEEIIESDKKITDKNAMLLFESFGFPIELTIEIANEKNIKVDYEGYKKLLEKAKDVSRNANKTNFVWNKQSKILVNLNIESKFIGYETLTSKNSKIIFMFKDDKKIDSAIDGEVVQILLDKTPFYAEKGGQIADSGVLIDKNGNIHQVIDVQCGPNLQNIHTIVVNNSIKLNDIVEAKVDTNRRELIARNHSATHLIHSAIRQIYGNQAMQIGSLNNERLLRIDINLKSLPTQEEINKITKIVKDQIKKELNREIYYCSLEESQRKYNALAFFTEKYLKIVRVVKFGDFSSELCGGTHVDNTKIIENFLITGVESKGSGVYRFTAITTNNTIKKYLNNLYEKEKHDIKKYIDKYNLLKVIKTNRKLEDLINKIVNFEINEDNFKQIKVLIKNFKDQFKLYQIDIEKIQSENKIKKFIDLKPTIYNDVSKLILIDNELELKELKILSNILQKKYKNLIFKGFNKNKKIALISCSKTIDNKYSAINLFNNEKQFKLKGGGNKNLAQGKIIN